MAITGGFGMTMDLERGTMRRWGIGSDGVKRWADTGEPVYQAKVRPITENDGDSLMLPRTKDQAEEFLRLAEQAAASFGVAGKDSHRIDWLEMMANQIGGILLHDGTEKGRLGLGLRPGMSEERTLREAIDEAMD